MRFEMAKHTITIEDLPDGGVYITSDPSLEELVALCATPDKMTSADGYAAAVHTAIKYESNGAWMQQLRDGSTKTH
jgi:hypothetical protein